jgi:hypothetical protein
MILLIKIVINQSLGTIYASKYLTSGGYNLSAWPRRLSGGVLGICDFKHKTPR